MKNSTQSGFTVPELVVTILFLGAVALTISQLFIAIGNTQERTNRLESASHAAQTEIEALRNNNYSQLQNGQAIDFTDKLPSNLPSGTGTVQVSEPTAGLKRVDVTVSYLDNGKQKDVKLSSLIGVIGISQ